MNRLEIPCRRCGHREAEIDGLCGPCIEAEAPQEPNGWSYGGGGWTWNGDEGVPAPPRRDRDLLGEMTKADWIAEVRADQDDGGTGSKARVARRLHYSVATIKRYWHKVADGDQWPTG